MAWPAGPIAGGRHRHAEIAVRLKIDEATVRRHKSRPLAKLGVERESELIAMARAAGFGKEMY